MLRKVISSGAALRMVRTRMPYFGLVLGAGGAAFLPGSGRGAAGLLQGGGAPPGLGPGRPGPLLTSGTAILMAMMVVAGPLCQSCNGVFTTRKSREGGGCGPPRGSRGRDKRLPGCLGRRPGPGTRFSPDLSPRARPSRGNTLERLLWREETPISTRSGPTKGPGGGPGRRTRGAGRSPTRRRRYPTPPQGPEPGPASFGLARSFFLYSPRLPSLIQRGAAPPPRVGVYEWIGLS